MNDPSEERQTCMAHLTGYSPKKIYGPATRHCSMAIDVSATQRNYVVGCVDLLIAIKLVDYVLIQQTISQVHIPKNPFSG